MDNELSEEVIEKFLIRVIEVEEKYAFVRKGQESSRKKEIENLVEDFCK